jgi:hypothetical protein
VAETPKRGGPTLLVTAGTAQAAYTAPAVAGAYSMVRDIEVANETASPVQVTLGIYTSAADAAGRRIIKSAVIAPNDSWSWAGSLHLLGSATTPDMIYAVCDTNNGATVTVSAIDGP